MTQGHCLQGFLVSCLSENDINFEINVNYKKVELILSGL